LLINFILIYKQYTGGHENATHIAKDINKKQKQAPKNISKKIKK
jgi:hypothetical protein